MNVDLQNVRIYEAFRRCINSTPLVEIHWLEDGQEVVIDKKLIEDFERTGLNNIDFITSKYYLR